MVVQKKLASLIPDMVQQGNSKTLEVAESVTPKDTKSVSSEEPKSVASELTESANDRQETTTSSQSKTKEGNSSRKKQTPEVTDIGSHEPKYLSLERKETRIRADQVESLGRISRELNRKRKGQGERITENTLIRIAIDLLLSRQDEIAGMTEEELGESLNL